MEKTKHFIGKVTGGLGKAQLFVAMPFYSKQFVKKLGFKPFPGTLNLRVEPKVKKALVKGKAIRITGRNGKGGATCFAIKLNKLNCFLIIPDKTTHSANVVEILSKHNLRKKLKLRNGCPVKLKLV